MRSIVHLDADAFFASVEQAADPRLRGKAVAVGGEKRGIIASASYEARRMGIYTPMPTSRARKLCPKLIVLPGDFDKYEQFSRWMFSYAYDFTPDVEIGSIDEGYFDLTGVRKPAMEVARIIRDAIRQSLKITVSEGLGSNKLVSQIASKLNKPAAFMQVPGGTEIAFLHPLPHRWLPGVGEKTGARLNAAGLARIEHIAATPTELLELLLGKLAFTLKQFSNGVDERPIVPISAPAKSYSQQETFAQDLTDEARIESVLRRMADNLMSKVRADGKSIRTVTVKVRYNDMDEDQCSESLVEPTDLETDLYGRLHEMLRTAWKRRVSLRLVSLKLSNVYDGAFRSELALGRDAREHEARERLARVVDDLRKTRGWDAVMRGHDLEFRKGNARKNLRIENRELAETRLHHPHLPLAIPFPKPVRRHIHVAPSKTTCLPLRVRSHYSFLNSTLSVQAIVDLAGQHELSAVALCDQGNLHGAVEFALAARAAGIKPIIGAEIVVEGRPLQLYVESETGYRNLCRLLSQDHRNRPRGRDEPKEMNCLLGFCDGLIAVSDDVRLAELFPGRFYFAATDPERVSVSFRLPVVPAWPVHYAVPADRWKFDVVQSIRTLTLLRQEHPEKVLDGEFHFRPPREMASLCPPRWLDFSNEIASRCRFAVPLGAPQFPAFNPSDGSTPHAFLRKLVLDGLQRRYPASGLRRPISQVEEELRIIAEVGYEEYFLVVWDILQECRRRGIEWITRGSAADSLVCYCLGISDVCPIRFDLYFRRFLNKDRMAMNKLPDIDVDFPHDRKDDVVDLIFERFGAKRCAVVGGFSTFQARSAFAEVAKVLGVAEREVRKFTDHFPWSFGGGWVPDEPTPGGGQGLIEMLRASPENRDLPLDEEPYRTALLMAEFLDGVPRYPKMHPCGVVLSRQPMQELTPAFVSQKGYPTTHFDMDAVEAIGLVKIDILAQGGLAVMRDVKAMLATRGITDWKVKNADRELPSGAPDNPPLPVGSSQFEIPATFNDPAVWDLISSGQARAVHHIESPAMLSLSRQCNVREIEGLIAIVSVIRPGAANEQKKLKFTRRYQGLEPVTYPHPSLEPCLRSTFGLVVYEEHILQICEAFAGLNPGRADMLRRALNKNKLAVIEEVHGEFLAAARTRGHSEEKIAEVWDLVRGFAGYAFCKAHSTAYGVEAYQAAWLKNYFPVEFMAAVLTNGKGFYDPLVYVLECHRLGIPLLAPWVNEPGPAFQVVRDSAIRVPVTHVKALTNRTRERLLAEHAHREFDSLQDFYRRVGPLPEEMETLIRVGAFDGFGQARTRQFWEGQTLIRAFDHSTEPGQGWLLPPNTNRLPDIALVEPTHRQKLEWENELLGFTASSHPLELCRNIAWDTYCPVARLGEFVQQEVVACGLVIEQRTHHQITGEPMKFLSLADWTGIVETELFAATYRSYGLATVRYPVLEITATVEPYENGRGFTLRVLRAGKPRTNKNETREENHYEEWRERRGSNP